MELEDDGDTKYNGCASNNSQKIGKGSGRFGN